MTQISTFVFFDIETTGLPWQEKNRTKITDLCLLAVNRQDIERLNSVPPVSKLSFVLNPERVINPTVVSLTGLTNEYLRYSPTFIQKSNTIINFLQDLSKPVCLIAHNGNTFDFKILLAEFNDANISLPADLLCVDTLTGFCKLLKGNVKINIPTIVNHDDDIFTDDEDVWTELNVTPEDWLQIDGLCKSSGNISCVNNEEYAQGGNSKKEVFTHKVTTKKEFQYLNIMRSAVIEKLFSNSNKTDNFLKNNEKDINGNVNKLKCKTNPGSADINNRKKGQFTLSGIYKKLLNKDFNAHRAEEDCFALLECVMAVKDNFLAWMDGASKSLTEIKPLVRN